MIKLTSLASVLFLTFQFVNAQPKHREIVNQPLEWFALTSNLKLNKSLSLIIEGQFRYADHFDPQQYQLRTALDVKLNDHFSLVPLGYVYTWNYKYGKQPAAFANNEHRIWQQISYKHSLWKLKIDHRIRLEQRFIQVHSYDNNDAVIEEGYSNKQNRLRYRFMARMPINGSTFSPKTYFITVYEEAFISWGDPVTFHEPDQNRLFAGLGYQVDKSLTLQAGFLYQMLIKSNGAKQENNVGFQVQINYNFDLTKTRE
jgi:predicted porin